jgi:hypothetical protein
MTLEEWLESLIRYLPDKDPMEYDREWFRDHPSRTCYVRHTLLAEASELFLSNWREMAARNPDMVLLTIVRELIRTNADTGEGMRARLGCSGLWEVAKGLGNAECLALWNQMNEGRTIQGQPANEVFSKLEAELKKQLPNV